MTDPAPFSAPARHANWSALGEETWDVLVVGGGITGAGIALDAACRGLRTALVEAGDFAQGTSSRSSRLAHGGLRYLETFQFRLVFEASAERRRLLTMAPHLVRPLPFLFPIFRGRGVGFRKLQAGMWLYDLLALFRNIQRHRMLNAKQVREIEPHLATERLRGGALYYDAQLDDARLTLAIARAAHEAGAATVSHAAVTAFPRDGGKVRGAVVRDRLGGGEQEVRARVVINATGPWSDAVRQIADPAAKSRLRPTKGVHIVVDKDRVGNTGAIIFPSAADGRIMFVLPWEHLTYIGTTDTDYAGPPEDVAASAADVEYLLKSANALFPRADLRTADVLATWAGVRPLLAPQRAAAEIATPREHEIWWDESGLLNIAGGKLTTYRVMAAQTVDAALPALNDAGVEAGRCYTDLIALPGAPDGAWETAREGLRERADALGLTAATAEHLALAYGADATLILGAVADDARQGELIAEGRPYIRAEIAHAVRHGMALTLEDVLVRRLHLLYELADGGLSAAPAVARTMAEQPQLGWSSKEVERQLAAYAETVAATRPPTSRR